MFEHYADGLTTSLWTHQKRVMLVEEVNEPTADPFQYIEIFTNFKKYFLLN